MRKKTELPKGANSLTRLQRQMVDYVGGTMRLIVQRQAIYLSVTILAAAYFDFWIAFVCYVSIQATEIIDIYFAKKIQAFNFLTSDREVKRFYTALMGNTVFSAVAISFFVFMIARQEGNTSHFTPLFFLFAAALFAGMNNHQLLPVLFTRLAIYTFTFLAIPIVDILAVDATIGSLLWLQFFTVVFVLFFVVDSSYIYIKLYRSNLDQLESLMEEKEKATAALIAKSQFLSTISHELRTPLTSVGGALSLLSSGVMGEVPEKQKKALTIAERNTRFLADLVGDVLDVQSLEADELILNMESVDLADVVEVSIGRNEAKALSASIELDLIRPLTSSPVWADRKRIDRILDCLISNAIKFSNPNSAIRLGVVSKNGESQITVIDEGEGIAEGKEDVVFSSFAQIDGSDVRKVGGVGIGLFLAKSILEKMGGTIAYNSVVGAGTTFTVSFKQLEAKNNASGDAQIP